MIKSGGGKPRKIWGRFRAGVKQGYEVPNEALGKGSRLEFWVREKFHGR